VELLGKMGRRELEECQQKISFAFWTDFVAEKSKNTKEFFEG